MPKIRHRKRVRTARLNSNPLLVPVPSGPSTVPSTSGPSTSTATTTSNGNGIIPAGAGGKKVGKKELEVTNLLDKLTSLKVEDRIWASVRIPFLSTSFLSLFILLTFYFDDGLLVSIKFNFINFTRNNFKIILK